MTKGVFQIMVGFNRGTKVPIVAIDNTRRKRLTVTSFFANVQSLGIHLAVHFLIPFCAYGICCIVAYSYSHLQEIDTHGFLPRPM